MAEADRNPIAKDFVTAAARATGVPVVDDFNAEPFADGTGFFSLAYEPEGNKRSSASVAYLHPVLDRPNLTLKLETWAHRLLTDEKDGSPGSRCAAPTANLPPYGPTVNCCCAPGRSTPRGC